MQIKESGVKDARPAPVLAGDTPIELSSIKTFDVHKMSYGYLSRICGNGFESLLRGGQRLVSNIGGSPALLEEARQKALEGDLRYICIYTKGGAQFTVFNVGQKTQWDMLLKRLHDSCPSMTA